MGNIVNPIGTADVKQVEAFLRTILENWKNYVTKNWKAVAYFFFMSIDFIVTQLDNTNLLGADKKATVLDVLSKVYDAIVPGMLPLLIKPFNTQIKNFIFNVVINVFIDYIVGKIHSNGGVA